MQAEAGASLISTIVASARGRALLARPRRALLVVGLAALVWAIDQASKQWALGALVPGVARPLVGDLLKLTLVFNPGAAFSLGTGFTPVLTTIMAVVAAGILVVARRVTSLLWATALGLLLGGAVGNLTDRLLRPPGFAHGHVVDFLQLPHWPVFNVADTCICTAAGLIILATFRGVPFADPDPRSAQARPGAGERPEADADTTPPAVAEDASG